MRAAACVITACAFGDPPPTKSPVIWRNFEKQPLPAAGMQRMQRAWDTAAAAARRWHEQFAREKLGPNVATPDKENAWKAVLRKRGDDRKSKLCELLMKDMGEKALVKESPSIEAIWQSNRKHLDPE